MREIKLYHYRIGYIPFNKTGKKNLVTIVDKSKDYVHRQFMEDPISFANRLSKIFHIPGQFFSFDLEDITINGESIITKEMRESRITIQMKLMETTKWQTK